MKKYTIHNWIKPVGTVVACILLGCSCTGDFFDINKNPYEPNDNEMNGDNYDVGGFFSQLEQSVIPTNRSQFQMSQNVVGDCYSGYLASVENFNNNRNSTTYFFPPDWLDAPFKSVYANELGAWVNIRKKIDAKTDNQSAKSDIFQLAQIIKVASMSRLTDLWGPMPYSQAGAGGLTTPYDSQEAIYKSFFKELDQAEAVLVQFMKENPGVKSMERFDLVYDGDYVKWLKFANSLRLRLALRIVYANPQLAKAEAEKAVQGPEGLIESNADNAALKTGHGIIINNPLEIMWDTYGDCRIGANISSIMNGYKDPRRVAYFQKAQVQGAGDYVGVRTGIEITDRACRQYSSPKVTSETPMMWMSAAEVMFLRSEGALWGWNMGMDAKTAYENGIALSFEQNGVGGADQYIGDGTSTPAAYVSPLFPKQNIDPVSTITIKWNDADNFETKQERIITQKWLAVFPNGQEGWTEYRRTGYPKLFPVMLSNSGDIPNTPTSQIARYPFPSSEYSLNGENLKKGIELLGGPDNGATKLWWDKKLNK